MPTRQTTRPLHETNYAISPRGLPTFSIALRDILSRHARLLTSKIILLLRRQVQVLQVIFLRTTCTLRELPSRVFFSGKVFSALPTAPVDSIVGRNRHTDSGIHMNVTVEGRAGHFWLKEIYSEA